MFSPLFLSKILDFFRVIVYNEYVYCVVWRIARTRTHMFLPDKSVKKGATYMSDIYEEYGLELETDNFPVENYGDPDKEIPRKKRKSGGWLKAAVALVLGAVIAFIGMFGGGYFVLNKPIGPTIEFIGGFTGLNYDEQVRDKILSTEYENKTLIEIGEALLEILEKKNLAVIDNVSPAVGDYVEEIVTNMNAEFGLSLDATTMMNKEFADLPTYIGDTFRVTPLGNLLKAIGKQETLEPLLMQLCYGDESHYTIDDNNVVHMKEGYKETTVEEFSNNLTGKLYNIVFASVFPPDVNDALMMSMAYGKEGVTYDLARNEDGTPVLEDNGSPKVEMRHLFFEMVDGQYCDHNGDPVDCKVETLKNGFIKMTKNPTFDGGEVYVYYLKEGKDGKFYAYTQPSDTVENQAKFQKTKIGDMTDPDQLLNTIYLKDALNVKYDPKHPQNDPHNILFSLAYGIEGVDYTVDPVTKEITMIDDAQPRSIGDLRNSGTDLINSVAIADIMEAELDDALSMYLLYGKKGVHYDFNEKGNLIMLQKYIAINEDGSQVYNEYGEELQVKTSQKQGYELDFEKSIYTDSNRNTYFYREVTPEKLIETKDGKMKAYYLFSDDGSTIAISDETYDDGTRKVYNAKGEPLTKQVEGYVLSRSTFTDVDGTLYHYQPASPEKFVETADGQVKLYHLFSKDSKKIAILQGENDTYKVYNQYGNLLTEKTDENNGYVLDVTNKKYTDEDGTVYTYQAAEPELTLDTEDGKAVKVYYLVAEDSKMIAISDDHKNVYDAAGQKLTPKVFGYTLKDNTYIDSHGRMFDCQAVNPAQTIQTADGKTVAVYHVYEYAMFTRHSLGELAGGDHLISNMNDRLTLAEVLGNNEKLSEDKFLKHVKDTKISNLTTAIGDLTVGQVFEEEIFITCQQYSGTPRESAQLDPTTGEPLMIEAGNWYYIVEKGGIDYYYRSEGEIAIRGTWKYLLTENNELRTDYKVAKDMNKMISNMTTNMEETTLYDMHNSGIMSFNKDTLKTPILSTYLEGKIDITSDLESEGITISSNTKLGNMTTDEIVAYMGILLGKLSDPLGKNSSSGQDPTDSQDSSGGQTIPDISDIPDIPNLPDISIE